MFNRRSFAQLEKFSLVVLVGLLLVQPSAFYLAWATTGIDNGFALGAEYEYLGSGISDFNFYFFSNGFTSSNGWPEQIVLTATANNRSFQIGILIYNSSYIRLEDECWNIGVTPPTRIWNQSYGVSGIINSWHTIELQFFIYGGIKYVGYYLDGLRYDSWNTAVSAFDHGMAPSAVIESADTIPSDWNGKTVVGYLRTGTTNLNTHFYGGTCGATHAGCYSVQDTRVYVGEDVQAPTNVGVTGYLLGYGASLYQFALGNTRYYFTIADQTILDEYSTFNVNCNVQVQVS